MLRAADRRGSGGVQVSNSVSIPAPVGGLNSRDSIANMPATDALRLENLFPNATNVQIRNGGSTFASFTGLCDSVLDWTGTSSTKLFVGVNNAGVYSLIEATGGGSISTAVVGGAGATVQALTSARFDHINVRTAGGSFILLCNGADPMLEYDGTTWSVGAITGVTGGTDEIKSIALYNERVWLMQKNSLSVWYLGIGAKSGAATELNLGALFRLGGSLACMMTVSLDSASAVADHICFVSTQGEVVTFKGNVSDATSWTRVSHVRIGRPVTYGVRSWTKLGSDAVIICADGVFPISRAILTDRSDIRFALTDKIRKFVNEAVSGYGINIAWGLIYHPFGNKLILNVPVTEGSGQTVSFQYVMNVETKAWCKFTNWDAISWLVVQDTLYFGMQGKLVTADSGQSDSFEAVVDDYFIYGYAKQAFNYLGSRGKLKHFKEMRINATLLSGSNVLIYSGLNTDFQDSAPTDFLTQAVATTGGVEVDTTIAEWIGATGIGYCCAPYISTAVSVQLSYRYAWVATDIIYETGGSL